MEKINVDFSASKGKQVERNESHYLSVKDWWLRTRAVHLIFISIGTKESAKRRKSMPVTLIFWWSFSHVNPRESLQESSVASSQELCLREGRWPKHIVMIFPWLVSAPSCDLTSGCYRENLLWQKGPACPARSYMKAEERNPKRNPLRKASVFGFSLSKVGAD